MEPTLGSLRGSLFLGCVCDVTSCLEFLLLHPFTVKRNKPISGLLSGHFILRTGKETKLVAHTCPLSTLETETGGLL